jgi:hypothetical protein
VTNDDQALLLDYLADDLTATEVDLLVGRLKSEPELADKLLSIAIHEGRLVEWARAVSATEGPALAGDVSTVDAAVVRNGAAIPRRDSRAPRSWTRRLLLVGGLATAAALMVALWMNSELQPSPSSSPNGAKSFSVAGSIARVVNESGGAEWFTENRTHSDISTIFCGDTIRLNAGSLRILFEHGTSLTLQAPSVLEVKTPMLARVHHGSIRVLVAKGAEGFSVVTPIAKVVDLGTEFGVRVDQRGSTDVVVFQGAVDVEGRSSDSGLLGISKRLLTGEAIRLDEMGTASRIVTIPSGQFPRGGGGSLESASNPRPRVISKVLDNIQRAENYYFYEIVNAGMREDCLAFVDRPDHQWNGVDAGGMPAYLIGGDYVRTFNNDKLNPDLEITLQLAAPATIYILLDERTKPPEWLQTSFEETGNRIGLDRGVGRLHKLGPDGKPQWTQLPTGTGPGVSIDDKFSIWKRVVPAAGDIVCGPLLGHDWDTNMYGIVAVPAKPEGDVLAQ